MRRKFTSAIAGLALAAGSIIGLSFTTPVAVAAAPSTPPAQICGNSAILDGPSTPPAGAVVVPAGDNSGMTWAEGTTYWFEPGVHTLGSGEFNQIVPKSNSRFVGAPGAVLDGQGLNRYAINNRNATGVIVEHLEMRNFVPPHQTALVNNGAGKGWTIQRNYIHDNRYGTAVNFGSDGVVRENCLTKNGQYGWKAYHPDNLTNLVLDRNEISYNNTERYDISKPGCGCSGAGKFWHASGVDVTGNWVHHNYGPGIWADTNDNDFLISGNYINDNNGKGIWYEISYNALIKDNTLIRNGLVEGPSNPSFPTGAIYIAESGGDSRVPARYSTIEITGNQMTDNWSGVVLWENANRFCGSNPTKHCTLVNPGVVTYEKCSDPATRANEPYYSDCRWKTQNVSVHHNTLTHDPANITDCASYESCGMAGALFSNWGNKEPWTGHVIKDAITYKQNNKFDYNSYAGPVKFLAYQMGRILAPADWQAAPYHQDVNSTFDGTPPPTSDEPTGTVVEHATFESDLDNHKNWYNAKLVRDSSAPLSGSYSLRIESAAAKNVGVTLDNWPGHKVITAGKEYDVSLLYREAAGIMPEATWTVTFRDSGGTALQTHKVGMPRVTAKTALSFRAVAPANASVIHWTFTYPASPIGTAMLVDDIKVQEVDGGTGTTTTPDQPVPVGSTVVFNGDFSPGNFTQYPILQNKDINGPPGNYCTYSACVVNAGSGHETAGRFEIRPGDQTSFDKEMNHIQANERSEAGKWFYELGDERWYEFSQMLPSGCQGPTIYHAVVMQWHGSGLNLSLNKNCDLIVFHRWQDRHKIIGPYDPGKWHDYVLHVKHHPDGSIGFVEAYRDGKLVLPKFYTPTMTTSTDRDGKIGYYRGPENYTSVIYYDDFRVTE